MNPGLRAVVVSITITSFSGVILVLRSISRFMIVRKNGADDILAIIAQILSVALTYDVCTQYSYGFGTDIERVSPYNQAELKKLGWIGIIVYGLCLTFLKLSALLQYLRFLNAGALRIICQLLIFICCCMGTATLFVSIFRCYPIDFVWNTSIEEGRCVDLAAFSFFAAALVISTNAITIALPMLAFKNLTMPKCQKRALIAVFALGALDFIASIIRIYTVWVSARSPNTTKAYANIALWSTVEVNMGIICISLPPIKALVVAILPPSAVTTDWKRSHESSFASAGILQLQPSDSVRANSVATARGGGPWAIP